AVVGCTALAASGGSGSRHVALTRTRFDLVLVDEASQLLLPTALGALLCLRSPDGTKCNESGRFVLVGDPHQLPPLVQSAKACQAGLDRSLFTHLLDLCHDRPSVPNGRVVELNLQYRMNAPILRLTNELSYSNSMQPIDSIVSNATLADRLCPLPARLFGDTMWNSCSGVDRQYSNQTEALLVAFLVRLLLQCGLDAVDLGVIAPHRSQVALLNRVLAEPTPGTMESTATRQLATGVEVNTVDQFQGRDKRAIVLSLTVCTSNQNTRRGPSRNLLEDLARLTVALTRAKHKLLVIGCSGRERSANESHDIHLFDHSDSVLHRLFELLFRSNDYHALTQDDFAFVKRLEQR
ncbi:DNA replication ATP-dependent helicase Dna2, partial [Paragonimus westermani]